MDKPLFFLANKRRPYLVVLWQADGGMPAHDLKFMYKPVMDTLIHGFTELPPDMEKALHTAGGVPRVIHGYGLAAWRRRSGAVKLRAGDVFVWIGPYGSEEPNWQAMRRAGVRTVYFQTEPTDTCSFANTDPNELWEYSWHNFDSCAPRLPAGTTLRYVPLGYSEPPAAALSGPRDPPAERHELTFFGFPYYNAGRKRCYERLKSALGPALNATWSNWSPDDFERWWRAYGREDRVEKKNHASPRTRLVDRHEHQCLRTWRSRPTGGGQCT